jgi:deoxyribodipyrimidine photo-lyase
MPWSRSQKTWQAWTEGKTGYPLVDAGIRELRTTGWMHNRVRMVVASFLTKDLMHDWRKGAEFFEAYLLDIDTASNNGGWQWSASTGVDPKPLRIFNPTLQAERFDPTGAYIRKFVPELRSVPDNHIHAPWTMPPAVQKEVGCAIGKDYPAPVIDHYEGSARFKAAYAEIKRGRDE